jgi:transglutaminase-like putative cysteine protease
MRTPTMNCTASDAPAAEPDAILQVEHRTSYDYASAVTQAWHLAHLTPLHDGAQRLLTHALHIEPEPAQRSDDSDAHGNRRVFFSLAQPHDTLRVRARSRVALVARRHGLVAADSPPWERLQRRLRYEAGAAFDEASEFAQPSPRVPRLASLRDYAAASFAPGVPAALAAIDLMQRIHADFEFETSSTEVDTPLIEAFELRRGVCQDFSHVMIAALRMHGLAARYVSGYLLTTPPPGRQALLGADASHAWVQLYCPDTPGVADGWLDLDPTNNLLPDLGHVRLAVGRDYDDVTPLRGVIRGGGRHTLDVRVSTQRVDGAHSGSDSAAPPA